MQAEDNKEAEIVKRNIKRKSYLEQNIAFLILLSRTQYIREGEGNYQESLVLSCQGGLNSLILSIERQFHCYSASVLIEGARILCHVQNILTIKLD